ncbi:MAG TPA: glutaredoxin family protein [Acidimicrobiia bacterium]|nr:glutaredoxin family protein [Acidimicrobiia bacterium]
MRSGCHLCDEAAPAVRLAARMAGAVVKTVDIDSHDSLVSVYGLRIPVVRVEGIDLAEGTVRTFDLWRRIMRVRLGSLR